MNRPSFEILLVEDNPNDLFLLQRALKANGIQNPVHAVADGAEALAYLSELARPENRALAVYPGLIVLDLKMPRKSGLEVLIWLRQHPEFSMIPAIVFTSSAQQTDVRLSYKYGANSYIVKPKTFDELKEVIRVIVEYWNVCEGLAPDITEVPAAG